MISIEELADILNRELSDEFIEVLHERWEENDTPIDVEHPEMESVLETLVDSINEMDNFVEGDYD